MLYIESFPIFKKINKRKRFIQKHLSRDIAKRPNAADSRSVD